MINKNFVIVFLGQIVSAFGSAVLRFAIPLYLLEISGSPALFGTVMAVSALPLVIMSPIGGVIADRVNKKRVIVIVDFIMAAAVTLYMITMGISPLVPATIAITMVLFVSTAMMDPAVEGSIPFLVPADQLVRANSIITSVSPLAGILGPALGGLLFTGFGIIPILIVVSVAKLLAAVMELFIRIPDVKQEATKNVFTMIFGDISQGLKFIFKEKPLIAKITITFFFVQLTLVPFVVIGIPVLINQHMQMSGNMVGIAQGIMGVGGLLGGITSGVLGNRLRIQKAHWLLFASSFVFIPTGVTFILSANSYVIFIAFVSALLLGMAAITMLTIQTFTYIQTESPPELLGKMSALTTMVVVMGMPIGQFIYGMLFEHFEILPWVVVFISVTATVTVALVSRRLFKRIPA